jgi:hypothetical protein
MFNTNIILSKCKTNNEYYIRRLNVVIFNLLISMKIENGAQNKAVDFPVMFRIHWLQIYTKVIKITKIHTRSAFISIAINIE